MQLYPNPLLRKMLAGVLVLAGSNIAATAQDLKSPLPKDPNLLTGKFANGLTYYVRPNHKPEKKVELRLMVKAGSILEDNDQQGLAHFMEHMNFNGTKNFQKNDLVSYLQSIGVEFGADLNAYTAFDQTVYILPIPIDKEGNLEKGFQIIEDWAHNALLTDKDIDEERNVVLEESRLGKGANDRMRKIYFPKYAAGTKYADRLPIGKDDILKTFKYETIRRYYHDWYRPDLQAVAVVGDIDTATAMKLIRKHFAGLQNPANEKKRDYVNVAPRTKAEAMVVTDKEATSPIYQLMFPHTKKAEQKTVGDYRDMLTRQLALQMLNQRLGDLAQSSNPPFPFAQVGFDDLIHGYEDFIAITAFSQEGGAEKSVNALNAELVRAKKFGFTRSELELAKKEIISTVEKQYNERTTTNSGNYVQEYIGAFLDGDAVPGIENENKLIHDMLPGIQLAEVNKQPGEWMPSMNTFSLIMAPDKAELKLPTDAQLLAMTQKSFEQNVTAKAEEKVASSLMDTKPQPGKVVSQTKEEGLDATTYTLSNGMKVTIKPTTFKSDEILFKGVKKGGTNNYGIADKQNAAYITNIIEESGIGKFSPTDLEKVLAGKTVDVSASMSDIQDAITGHSTVNDFEAMLQLANLYITSPRKDVALFNAFKDKMKQQLMFITANPQAAFIDTTMKTLFNGNPLARTPIPAATDFDKINLDRAFDIYKNEFGSADGYQFFIVGNVNPETAIPLIETYLGSIPAANKPAEFKDNGVRPITGDHTLKFKKGTEKKSLIVAQYYGEAPYSEDLGLKAQAVAEILNIKVIQNMREKLGAIYSGGFNASVSQYPYSRYTIGLQLPCGPENVDKLLTAAADEIKNLKEKGPDAADLDKVKTTWHEQYRTSVKENKYWQSKLESVLFMGRDRNHVTQYDAWIDKLTPADVQAAAKQLFDGKNQFTSILYPES
ncbi:M16 family metallopeptidase [Chitinophagaceae bacterium MMS25-I14]